MGVLKARKGMQHGKLHVLRKGGGKALQIDLPRILSHRLGEKLVPVLGREADDLILNAGTVARSHALDRSVVKGGAVEIFRMIRWVSEVV